MNNVLLLGATGRTGGLFLTRALEAGHRVTAVVRQPDFDVTHERLTVHHGSACDPEVLRPLLPGHDAVVSTLGPRWPTRRAAAVYPDSAAALLPAMWEAGVERVLVTSTALLFEGAGWMTTMLRRLVPAIVDGAGRMEARIRDAAIDWTVVRTGFLTDAPGAEYRLAVDAMPDPSAGLPRAALATFLLEELQSGNHRRQVVGLSG